MFEACRIPMTKPSNAGLAILLLIAVLAATKIAQPTRLTPVRPCGDMRLVTIGGSMVVGCRTRP